ncbi:MAG: DUF3592 domain-containing protein [Hyphomicrobium sp.]
MSDYRPPSSARARTKRMLAFACALLGVLAIGLGGYGAMTAAKGIASREKAPGEVVRIIPKGNGRAATPVIAFRDAAGAEQTFISRLENGARYEVGDRVLVLYGGAQPGEADVISYFEIFAGPFSVVSAGALLLLIAAVIARSSAFVNPDEARPASPERQATERAAADRAQPRNARDGLARMQFHPFNPVAFRHYLAELASPAGAPRKVKITDAAAALVQDRWPVTLGEMLACMTAIAHEPDAAAFVAKHLPRLGAPRAFERDGASALVFLFEGVACIVVTATGIDGLWQRLANLVTPLAGPRQYVPGETVWDASPRHRGVARAWEGLRDDVEAWVKAHAPPSDPPPQFMFAGHGAGGALAVVAAYEFVKRGRAVSAVITFGAVKPGGEDFARECRQLGIDERTLDIHSGPGLLPGLQWPFRDAAVGGHWRLDTLALDDRQATSPEVIGTSIASYALTVLRRDDALVAGRKRPWSRAFVLALLSGSPAARRVMARHDIQRYYVRTLSALIHRRLRELTASSAIGFAAADAAFSDHFLDISGRRPSSSAVEIMTKDGES